MSIVASLATCAQLSHAHGRLVWPPAPASIEDIDWSNNWFTQGTMIGCKVANGENCDAESPCCDPSELMKPTLTDEALLTFPDMSFTASAGTNSGYKKKNDAKRLRGLKQVAEKKPINLTGAFRYNPWKAPGYAPVANPCGILGGWRYDNARDYIAGPGNSLELYKASKGGPTNTEMPPANMTTPAGTHGTTALLYDQNMKMQQAQGGKIAPPTYNVWKAGSTAEVAFNLVANHGGGYMYRLCKLEHLYNGSLSEECFQANPLDYASDESWFQVGSDSNNRTAFKAARVTASNTAGVKPAGATWTKNPLPACVGLSGGSGSPGTCEKPQFTPPVPGLWGFGNAESQNSPLLASVLNNYSFVDKVKVPEGLSGEYVLSWRWDSEQTAQVWTTCSIVVLE